jgi:tetratricopeptide (TPR) repeat protein
MTSLLFLGVFVAYLAGLPPALAPWRDTGELTTAAATLGVAHAPSYPLYVLLSNLGLRLPLGNPAFRLNLLSAVVFSAAVAWLSFELRLRRGALPALAGALLLAGDPRAIAVGQVSEMYALWVLGAVGLLALARRLAEGQARLFPAFCFLAGLLLGNRLDLLLWAPGLAWLALCSRPQGEGEPLAWGAAAFALVPGFVLATGANWPVAALALGTFAWRARGEGFGRRAGEAALWGLAGLSIYLYLPVRSASGPFLDWNHPSTLSNFLDSLLRTRYGGTLDLISKSYARGELFGDNMRLWGAHLWDAFGPLGLFAALTGAATSWQRERGRFIGEAAAWWWCGPVFLFLANMPPNPHAAAIVEPHYLLSDVLLCVWAADGVAALAAVRPLAAPAFAAAALLWPLWREVPQRMDRRWHLADYDYAANVLAAAPPNAVVVAKKDVPLYALWHHQALHGWRPDVAVVAQGLSGSPWYIADWRRRDPSLPVSNLREPGGWLTLGTARPVYATQDVELPAPLGASARPAGLLQAVTPNAAESDAWPFLVRRGVMRYDAAPDFFTADLIDGYAAASYRAGLRLHQQGKTAQAVERLHDAWAMEWDFPELAGYLGYIAASAGRWDEAAAAFALADALFARKLELAQRYRALPDLVASIRRQAAEAVTSRGAAAEKRGDRAGAENAYARAIALHPLAQTYYNRAVLSWNRDWQATEADLEAALRLDPSHAEARKYLTLLRSRRR